MTANWLAKQPFVDDLSHQIWLYLLKNKSEVFESYKTFEREVTTFKMLRSDNAGEYLSIEFKTHLQLAGTIHQTSIPHTPAQNGVAERTIKTMSECTRTELAESEAPKSFWGEAMMCAVYVRNRVSNRRRQDTN